MLRTALRPRWLALLLLVLLLAAGMSRLGTWQLERAREQGGGDDAAREQQARVELLDLVAPQQALTEDEADRQVSATGSWVPDDQLLVADRYLDGVEGLWVLTPFLLADGSEVAVVRGWVASADDPAAAADLLPAGTVTLEGVLRPGEAPIDRDPGETAGLPDGQIDGIDLTQLVRLWDGPLVTGYVVATAADPAQSGTAPAAVPPTLPSSDDLAWRNLSYAVQWFVFAGFGVFMWWRLVRDDHLARPVPAAAGAGPGPGPGPTPDPDPAPDGGTPCERP